jgi:membrane fusion protein (multidrug efflux system)
MRFYFSALSCFFILFIFSCSEEKAESNEQSMDSFRSEVEATPVRVALSEKKTFDYLINASGKIEALDQLKVIFERSGYLTELNVKEGDYVEKGKILAKLDQTESLFKLEKAKINLKNAEATYQSEILSFDGIFTSGDSARIIPVRDQLMAKSGLFTAQLELKEAELDLEKSIIKAPTSGRVADLQVKTGSLVNAGDELMEIINPSQLELKVKVLESDIHMVSIGQGAEIIPVGSGGTQLSGKVRSINPKVDENGLVLVGIQVTESKGLLPGMNARAIIKAPQSNSIVVPKQAVVSRSGRPVVFTVVNGNESKWNYVEPGKDNGREVEILEGLEAGETVIVTNNLQLAHQAPVQPVKD